METEAQKRAKVKYRESEKGKITQKRYWQSEKGKSKIKKSSKKYYLKRTNEYNSLSDSDQLELLEKKRIEIMKTLLKK